MMESSQTTPPKMTPANLKAILTQFLDHFEELERHHKLSAETSGYFREFMSLKRLTEDLKKESYYSVSEGHQQVNLVKNRYKDILPYNHSRVVLSDYPGVPGSDYMNANYVRGSSGSSCAYIAAQGPLPNTLVDFWRMIWETEVTVIIMACNEHEGGKYKCEVYWPDGKELHEQQYGNMNVKFVKWRQVCPDFLVRTFKVTCEGKERIVCQFHYTTWPDHGVPEAVQPILELVRLMRDVQATETRPILVHCSAGCGRTGTICSIDYVWALLRTGKLSENFSLYKIISDLRRQRIAMVQTLEQYMLCYKAVANLFEQQLKMIGAHHYENISQDGEPIVPREFQDNCSSTKILDEPSLSSEETAKQDTLEKRKTNRLSIFIPSQPTDSAEGSKEKVDINSAQPVNDSERLDDKENVRIAATEQLSRATKINSLPDDKVISVGCNTSSPCEGKLVGKATVIRRPSIAKLKALFENSQSSCSSTESISQRPRGHLTRSQSTRDATNSNSIMALVPFHRQRHPYENEDIPSQSTTSSISYQNEKIPNQSSQLDGSEENSAQTPTRAKRNKRHTIFGQPTSLEKSRLHPRNLQIMQITRELKERNKKLEATKSENEVGASTNLNGAFGDQRDSGNVNLLPQPLIDESRQQCSSRSTVESNPPPKPPRTYQHTVRKEMKFASEFPLLLPSMSAGRVTEKVKPLTLPKRIHSVVGQIDLNRTAPVDSIYEPLSNTISRPFNVSAPNLVQPAEMKVMEISVDGPPNQTTYPHQPQATAYSQQNLYCNLAELKQYYHSPPDQNLYENAQQILLARQAQAQAHAKAQYQANTSIYANTGNRICMVHPANPQLAYAMGNHGPFHLQGSNVIPQQNPLLARPQPPPPPTNQSLSIISNSNYINLNSTLSNQAQRPQGPTRLPTYEMTYGICNTSLAGRQVLSKARIVPPKESAPACQVHPSTVTSGPVSYVREGARPQRINAPPTTKSNFSAIVAKLPHKCIRPSRVTPEEDTYSLSDEQHTRSHKLDKDTTRTVNGSSVNAESDNSFASWASALSSALKFRKKSKSAKSKDDSIRVLPSGNVIPPHHQNHHHHHHQFATVRQFQTNPLPLPDRSSLLPPSNGLTNMMKPPHSHRFSPPAQWTQV